MKQLSPAEDFADKCDRIMNELVQPATPKPMPVWIDETLFNHLYAQVNVMGTAAVIISSHDVVIINRVDWTPTGGDLINAINHKPFTDTKSKNPMASQQAWKKKHRR